MRLLNINDLKFSVFKEKDLHPYAIASHRWQDGETTYHDIRERKFDGAGYKKVKRFCKFTRKMNDLRKQNGSRVPSIAWIWIDTCCIDHSASQDVQENINSMYKYYERATECYAYLFDVPAASHGAAFLHSSWFLRGWTLQELLAPKTVIFVDAGWNVLGHKCTVQSRNHECQGVRGQQMGRQLNQFIYLRTRIPRTVLNKSDNVLAMDSATVSRWAYLRQTERVEDMAYCLLGLLGLFMNTIYGEGAYAWTRLEGELSSKRRLESRLIKPKQLEDLQRSDWDRIWRNGPPPDYSERKGSGSGSGGGSSGAGAGARGDSDDESDGHSDDDDDGGDPDGGGQPHGGGGQGQGPGGPGGAGGNANDSIDEDDSSDGGRRGEGGPVDRRRNHPPGQAPRYSGPQARLAGNGPGFQSEASSMTSYIRDPDEDYMRSRSQASTDYQLSSYNQRSPTGLSEITISNSRALPSSHSVTSGQFTPQTTQAVIEMAARSGMSQQDATRHLASQYSQMSLARPSQASRAIQVGLNLLHPASAQDEREMSWSSRQMRRTMEQSNARARVTSARAEDSDADMDDDSDEDSDGGNAVFA